ncbi:hypothetical protein SGQ44_16840 [Flavobacterium sp. Fl-77]|uniref:Uncharacterized protein n=1 Tax=Flavobacterium flavipigmentatum TaxID=2893884 RepID=A0AAJ2SE14_9FLAO|nr:MULTISPECIES: hypothetical protein [unclassified Flavobacterium]MDX6183827.1 hypothetical protein [Flavobacterium sp. Fl-33]MDX6187429.1 hypothetical protein [Flavobacterium sp. Fl-77]UFH40331.1 hypothetical protein LNP22_08650 [Flavobacterium sp. F-70]
MEPNNFEKDFRKKLNQRTIAPSDKAWDRLDAMLSIVEEKKSPVRSFPTAKKRGLYVAASLVGFLLLGTFFFQQKKDAVEIPKNNVAVEENSQNDSVIKPVLYTNDSDKISIASREEAFEKKSSQKENQNSNQSIKKEQNQVAESSIIKNNQEKQSINNQNSMVETSKSESEDQLLSSAKEPMVVEHLAKPKTKIKINANDLLDQVDGELELSFREKIITKVNKNYQTVKVALANRNQQE